MVEAALGTDRYLVAVDLAVGLGLRQGEVFGLSPDDVDFLRESVEVRRQVKLLSGTKLLFRLPKGNIVRTVALPSSVRDHLAAFLAEYPAQAVSLPWGDTDMRRCSWTPGRAAKR